MKLLNQVIYLLKNNFMKNKNIAVLLLFLVTFSVFVSKAFCFDSDVSQCESFNEKKEYNKAAICYDNILKKNKPNQIESFGQKYKNIEISMSKKQVLNFLGEPTKKKAISLKTGIFECWRWNTQPYANYTNLDDFTSAPSLLFLNGYIVQTGLDFCPKF